MNALIRNNRKFPWQYYSTQSNRKCRKYSTFYFRSQLSSRYHLNDRTFNFGGTVISSVYSFRPLNYAIVLSSAHSKSMAIIPIYSYNSVREFSLNQMLCENPSSKVEATVQTMKNKQKEKVEEIIKEATNIAATTGTKPQAPVIPPEPQQKVVPVKKPLKTRIWAELVHYYHGFRLLIIDINICRKLLWRVLNGKTLTRRENRLLVRTTSDLFRLIPFSVFIIVPFMELLLPLFIKFFPGMLPSTFQTAKEREDKLKQSLQVKLEMAKFLQKTLDEMAVQHKEHKSEEASQFVDFFKKIKDPNQYVSSDDIIKFAKRFEDEITLDSLSREQLVALCRVLELNTVGTSNFLRFQLRVKLRSLAADDRVISREGVEALDLFELQQACKARGMRAYGLTAERLRTQLQEWIDLSLNEKVPPTLLLLSRAMLISDDALTSEKLKETIRVLPDAVATKTKAAIGEREGKIDNKAKIELIKEEERKIKEEHEEEKEQEKTEKEILVDKATAIESAAIPPPQADEPKPCDPITLEKASEEKSISSKDVEMLSDALKLLSSDQNKMVVEKETIKDLKEEMQDYKEDVEELREVRKVVQEPVHESRAAKVLFKKVNKMIDNLDSSLTNLNKKHNQLEESAAKELSPAEAAIKRRQEELVYIDDLIETIKKVKQTPDDIRLKQIENVLSKMDKDKDGIITVDNVLKVVEAIGRDNVKLNEKQIEELITLLHKEQLIETEVKIEKALAKSMKEAQKQDEALAKSLKDAQKQDEALVKTLIEAQKQDEALVKSLKEAQKQDKEMKDTTPELKDSAAEVVDTAKNLMKNINIKENENKDLAPELKDKATDLCIDEKKNVLSSETDKEHPKNKILETVVEKQTEKILPKADIASALPPRTTSIPPPTSNTSSQVNSKDKMI